MGPMKDDDLFINFTIYDAFIDLNIVINETFKAPIPLKIQIKDKSWKFEKG